MNNCLFCHIVAGDVPADKVYEDEFILAFRDINPQAPTHILIIPKKHFATISDIMDTDTELMGRLYQAAKTIAKQEGIIVNQQDKGYRLIMNCGKGGGQEIWHIHMHLLAGRPLLWPPG